MYLVNERRTRYRQGGNCCEKFLEAKEAIWNIRSVVVNPGPHVRGVKQLTFLTSQMPSILFGGDLLILIWFMTCPVIAVEKSSLSKVT